MDDLRSLAQTGLHTLIEQGTLSRIDTLFVRELAEAEKVSPAQVIVAARLLQRYRPHLEMLDLSALDESQLTMWAIQQPDALNNDYFHAAMLLAQELADRGEIPTVEDVDAMEPLLYGEIGSDVVHKSTEEKPVKRIS